MDIQHHPSEHPMHAMARGPLIAGLLLLFLGIYFLLERAQIVPDFRVSWPIILIIVGIALVVSYLVNAGRR